MSYILDALRKSEQQRQATQPDNVTDRILVNQPQPKPKRNPWLVGLVIGNLLAIAGAAWFFMQKPTPHLPEKTASAQQTQPPVSHSGQKANPQNALSHPVVPATPSLSKPVTPAPSIAQVIENNKVIEAQKPTKKIPDKKPLPVKKERIAQAIPKTVPEPAYISEKPTISRPRPNGTPDLNELTNDERNGLPNLTVNVFSYAQEPEDRFVIIDMVKYKTGQLVKGQVKLKEIRPDSILLENENGRTFKVER